MGLPVEVASRPARLRSSSAVVATLRRGRRRSGAFASVHARDNDVPFTRLGVMASRKVGSAVQRNRAKRLLREAAGDLHWREGFDVVLVARPDCASASYQEVREDVARLGRSLELIDGT